MFFGSWAESKMKLTMQFYESDPNLINCNGLFFDSLKAVMHMMLQDANMLISKNTALTKCIEINYLSCTVL